MRGLAFPSIIPGTRELTDPNALPATLNDIPIDPALGGTPVDPALLSDTQPSISPQAPSPPVALPDFSSASLPPPDQWSHERLPEGDPFAPQNTIPYLPIIEQPAHPPPNSKPGKRRRRFHRDEECSFCQGNDAKNKVGEPELMVTCHECGRGSHPSCMELSKIGDMLRSYPWKCIECKNCEVCLEKGDDERILFCDGCDRGWHFDCMNPPINELPEGEWYCPPCQEAATQQFYPQLPLPLQPPPDMLLDDMQALPPESNRETSVASSSRSVPVAAPSQAKSAGRSRNNARKLRQQIADESEGNEDAEIDVEDTTAVQTQTPAPRARTRDRSSRPSKRSRLQRRDGEEEEEEEEEEAAQEGEEEDVEVTPMQPRSRKRKRERDPDSSPASIPRVRLRLPTMRNSGKGKEKEEQEEPLGMFEGILGVEERDISKTTVMNHDKQLFERSRLEAERKLASLLLTQSTSNTSTGNHAFSRTPISASDTPTFFETPSAGPSRPTRSATQQQHGQTQPPPTPSPVPSTPGGPNASALYAFTSRGDPDSLRIKTIRFGQYDIRTWYDAPFPEEYASIPDGRMWICEFCLKYMKSRFQAMRHRLKCKVRHPPGDEIYRDGGISIFEVDGRKNKIYCQNLCLLSKMFLDHKSLFYDVEPFLFYVITEVDDFGARFVGYFSKEKRSPKDYNVSCIMTLPVRQRQGWGNLLIDFSYLLSKVEQRSGSPEKPLSSLGALGYRNYWTLAVMRYLESAVDHPRLEEIISATSMTLEDVYETLAQQSMIFIREPTPPPIKPIPGQAIRINKSRKSGTYTPTSLRRSKSSNQLHRAQSRYKSQDLSAGGESSGGMFVPPKHYEIRFDREKVKEYLRNWEAKGYLTLKPEKLQWTPYLLTRSAMEESKAKEKNVNGIVINGIVAEGSEVGMMNGRHSEGVSTTSSGKASTSPAPSVPLFMDNTNLQEEEEEDELPVPGQMRRLTRRESTQTPRRMRQGESTKNELESSVSRRLRGRSNHYGDTRTPTPTKRGVEEEGEDEPRSVRWRRRLTRKHEDDEEVVEEEEEEEEDEKKKEKRMEGTVLGATLVVEEQKEGRQLRSRIATVGVTTPRKRRRVEEPESGSKACGSVGADQAGSRGGEKGETSEGCGAGPGGGVVVVGGEDVDVKYEDAGTPLTSVTSPSDETVFGLEVVQMEKRAGLPVSDERSTLDMEMEMGDEDAEGSDEEEAEVECSI